jgi:23S rRNA G2069 N7-methylase RlmK/C1962 C5-methylase RlmI
VQSDLPGTARPTALALARLSPDESADVFAFDPPSFSNSKKMQGVLDVQRDHVRLVSQRHALLARGGELFFSTNLRSCEIDPDLVQRLALREITHQTVPEDFSRPGRRPHRAWHTSN